MTTHMPNDVLVKLQKLARLARCHAATKGEATTAATMAVKIARKNHIDLTGYADLLAMASAPEPKPPGSPLPNLKPRDSVPPSVKPWDPPPVERQSFSGQWDSKPPDYAPRFTTPPYTRPPSPKPPRSKPKNKKPQDLLSVMPSGQYRGKTFEEIFQLDPDYLTWVLRAHPDHKKIRVSILAFLQTKQPSR